MNLDQFKPLTVYTIYIVSTPEKVWDCLLYTSDAADE